MKKLTVLLSCLALLGFTSCSDNSDDDNKESGNTSQTTTDSDKSENQCTGNDGRCFGAQPQKCENGHWVNAKACDSGYSCKNKGECIKDQGTSGDNTQTGDGKSTDNKEQITCAKDEQAKCVTVDGKEWAVICHDGDVYSKNNCTANGALCYEDDFPYEGEKGTYHDAWCDLEECTSNTQCAKVDPEFPICDTEYGLCVECLTNNDCASSDYGPICDTMEGYCVECLTNNDCANSEYGPICDEEEGMCIECLKDTDCDDGYKCSVDQEDSSNNECVKDSSGKTDPAQDEEQDKDQNQDKDQDQDKTNPCSDKEDGEYCLTIDGQSWAAVCKDETLVPYEIDDMFGTGIGYGSINCTASGSVCLEADGNKSMTCGCTKDDDCSLSHKCNTEVGQCNEVVG